MADASYSVRGGDRAIKVLEAIGRAAHSAHVKVGYLAGATYPDGTPVAQVAFWQEFGTPGAQFPIPPRPTFRTMISQHSAEWGSQLAKVLKAADYDSQQALALMGETIKDELIDSLLHADVAQLSAVTLMLRKMRSEEPDMRMGITAVFEAIRRVQAGDEGATGTQAKRLVDSGQMLRTPDYEVVGGAS